MIAAVQGANVISTDKLRVHVHRGFRNDDGTATYARGWPKHEDGAPALTMKLREALTKRFAFEAFLTAYEPTKVERRLTTCLLSKPEALERLDEGAVLMSLFLADVDCHGKSPEEVDAWFDASERPKVEALREAHPGILVYRSRGGYRLLGALELLSPIRSVDDAKEWGRATMAWRAYLRRCFGINVDPLHDWTRYQRVPHDTRDPDSGPEERETIGDTNVVGIWEPALTDEDWEEADRELAPKTKPRDPGLPQPSMRAPGAPTIFRELLKGRGLLGAFDGEKWHTVCPLEHEHGQPDQRSKTDDTVLYENDGQWGGIFCLHSNCGHDRLRDAKDWMGHFSDSEIASAKAACGIEDTRVASMRSTVIGKSVSRSMGAARPVPLSVVELDVDAEERAAIEGETASNVRRGPWAGSEKPNVAPFVFAFPSVSDDAEQAPDPTACVPEPEGWGDDDAVPPPPVVPPAHRSKLRDVTVNAIGARVLEVVDANFEGFVYDAGRFWIYWEGRYLRLPDWWLLKTIKAYHGAKSVQQEEGDGTGMPFLSSVTNLKAVQSLIAIDLAARQNSAMEGSYFDGSTALAVFRNGALVVDAHGKPEWTTHSPTHRARYRFEFDYEPGLVPSHFLAVANDWFRGLEQSEVDTTILAIRQYAGHMVLNSLHRLKLSQALLMLGKGHDGKSTLINLLRACLPPGSTAELDPAALGAKSATVDLARAALHGKLANLCDDCSAQPWSDTSFLKRVLDHAWVSARRIGGDPFTYRATLASVFACNELPRVGDKSFGFFRRWLLIQFPNTIPASARDPRLEQKILGLEKRELTCWFVDAALEMLREGGPRTLVEPKCHRELLSKWAAGDDSVAGFVTGYTEDAGKDKAAWTSIAALFDAYVLWCKWAYGDFRAMRETQSKDYFAKALPSLHGVQTARTGKACTRVVNRRLRQTEAL